MPRRAKRAVRGGILGNYVDQFDIFLALLTLPWVVERGAEVQHAVSA